jgi:hypothetical protein
VSYVNRDGPAGTVAAMRASNPAGHVPAAMTIAHQAATTAAALGHVAVHADAALAAGSLDEAHTHAKHVVHHSGEAADHHGRMLDSLSEHDPGIAAELDKLKSATPGDQEFTPPEGAEQP